MKIIMTKIKVQDDTNLIFHSQDQLRPVKQVTAKLAKLQRQRDS